MNAKLITPILAAAALGLTSFAFASESGFVHSASRDLFQEFRPILPPGEQHSTERR